ncbi:MAG TPA: septum site-determining protein Ssd [Nocardioidaceae bacterium]|nr:septum site-determining protein Ssd [Nocardioidaceae bacterium]
MHPPLLVTDDSDLLDDLVRLSAAAGVALDVAPDLRTALRLWAGAPLVLVGQDLAPDLAAQATPRRGEVFVLARDEPDFRSAVALGARDVLSLPEEDDQVVELLADVGDGGARSALTIGVTGGSGGVGATTLACAVAGAAARSGRVLAMDLDPWGPGVGRVLGVDPLGLTWRELVGSRGRLGSRALRDALPRQGDLAVLGWGEADPTVDEVAVRDVLAAAQRGHDLVVVDLPRREDPWVEEVAGRCDHVLLVAGCSVLGAASAMRALASLRAMSGSIQLVARTSGRAVPADVLASALDLPLVACLGQQRGLDEQLDLGLGPLHNPKGAVARAAAQVLERLAR